MNKAKQKLKGVDYLNPKWMLRGKVISKYGSLSAFADHIGTTKATVSNKISGRTQMSQEDIIKWAEALDMESDAVMEYFFPQLVSKS